MSITCADDFRALARDIITNTPDPDPGVAADKILGEMSDKECRVALAVTLQGWVRVTRSSITRDVLRSGADRKPDRDPVTNQPIGSSVVARIREWFSEVCAMSQFNGEEWKPFGEFTPGDADGAAQVRYDQARATEAEAAKYRELADMLRDRKCKTVSALPPRVFESIWKDAS